MLGDADRLLESEPRLKTLRGLAVLLGTAVQSAPLKSALSVRECSAIGASSSQVGC
jgi:hypothetical protein